jgi:hypothetical protein
MPRPSQNLPIALLGFTLFAAAASQVAGVFNFVDKDPGEGHLLAMTMRMWREPISSKWIEPKNYTLACYGPGYLWATMAAQRAAGSYNSIIPGRFVSLTATWLTAFLLAWAVLRETRMPNAALLAALFYVVSTPVPWWGHVHRVDALAILCSTAAVVAAGPAFRRPWLSAVLIVAGSLVKQTAALSAVGIFLYFLLQKQYRTAILYGLLVACLGLAAWTGLIFATDRYFLIMGVRDNINAMSAYQGLRTTCRFLYVPVTLGALGTLAFWLIADRRKARRMFRSVYVVAFFVGTLIYGVLSAKEGAGFYYFMEPTAMAAIIAARFGVSALERRSPKVFRYVSLGIAAAALCWSAAFFQQQCAAGAGQWKTQVETLKTLGGARVLADCEYVDEALAANLTLTVNEPYCIRTMNDRGMISLTPLLSMMADGEVQYLLLNKTPERHEADDRIRPQEKRWPAAMLDSMKRYYQFDQKCGNMLVFRYCRPASTHAPTGVRPDK